jgi:hypothetical protein
VYGTVELAGLCRERFHPPKPCSPRRLAAGFAVAGAARPGSQQAPAPGGRVGCRIAWARAKVPIPSTPYGGHLRPCNSTPRLCAPIAPPARANKGAGSVVNLPARCGAAAGPATRAPPRRARASRRPSLEPPRVRRHGGCSGGTQTRPPPRSQAAAAGRTGHRAAGGGVGAKGGGWLGCGPLWARRARHARGQQGRVRMPGGGAGHAAGCRLMGRRRQGRGGLQGLLVSWRAGGRHGEAMARGRAVGARGVTRLKGARARRWDLPAGKTLAGKRRGENKTTAAGRRQVRARGHSGRRRFFRGQFEPGRARPRAAPPPVPPQATRRRGEGPRSSGPRGALAACAAAPRRRFRSARGGAAGAGSGKWAVVR